MSSPSPNRTAKEIFLKAIDVDSPEERRQFLDQICDNDDELRRRVEALIAAHDDPDSYLDRPAAKFDVAETTDGSSGGSGLSDSSSHHGRFLPGTKIAGRYRIVSMLGRGGMGEVYRADDLRLGQTVALKFLPPELAKDPKRLEYFHNEVRLARQITHPNVCRVYDLGEVDGQHFISMEYIDGEDLKVLLHRIGRLPEDKGTQIAQQLCAGLAAAHQQGVLHRDLKPANIMIDGQGQVRITDFGLATISEDDANVVGMSGTPAYMAPEQLLRGQTSIQSDIYSLGLILHEMFTGQPIHSARSMAELRRFHQESSRPLTNSDSSVELDAAVDRAIRRCLEPDPSDRPLSVPQLASSLPGGDPLAAALAAGETPRPELVAASGGAGTLNPRAVVACLVSIVVLLAGAVFCSKWTHFVNLTPLEKPPEYLRERAKEVIKHLGYDEPAYDSAGGFRGSSLDYRYVTNAEFDDPVEHRLNMFRESPWHACQYWYRESPGPLVAREYRLREWDSDRTRVTDSSPPWNTPGMVGVRLDLFGHLRRFRVVPSRKLTESETLEPHWAEWFPESIVGFNLSDLESSRGDWIVTPSTPYDSLAAWEGNWPDSDEPLKVVAAGYRGRPVFFDVIQPGAIDSDLLSDRYRNDLFGLIMTGMATAVALSITVFHLRTGRGDGAGAIRVGGGVAFLEFIAWLFNASHVAGTQELSLLQTGLGMALFRGVFAGVLYLAVEPLVRRDWPELLVSMTRMLQGRLQSPRIGRDLLIGTLAGCFNYCINWLPSVIVDPSLVVINSFQVLSKSTSLASELSNSIIHALMGGLTGMVILWIVYRLTRNKIATFIVLVCLLTAVTSTQFGVPTWFVPILVVSNVTTIGVALRYGILAGMWAGATFLILRWTPITADGDAFYFEQGVVVLGMLLTVALYGAYRSLSRVRLEVGV